MGRFATLDRSNLSDSMPLFWSLLAAFIIFALVGGGLSLAPWVPTRRRDLERINRFIGLSQGETLYELGCGEGRVSHFLARQNPQAMVVGVEISPLLYGVARFRQLLSPLPNLQFRRGNFYYLKISDGDAFYTFATPATLGRLHTHLAKAVKKPGRLISYAFHLEGQEAARTSGNRAHEALLFEYKL